MIVFHQTMRLLPNDYSRYKRFIRDQINLILAPGAKKDEAPVKEVLFTSFIIQ